MYKGVHEVKRYYSQKIHRFKATIQYDGDVINCGYAATPREAAIARDKTILRMGLNVPLQVLKPVNVSKDAKR